MNFRKTLLALSIIAPVCSTYAQTEATPAPGFSQPAINYTGPAPDVIGYTGAIAPISPIFGDIQEAQLGSFVLDTIEDLDGDGLNDILTAETAPTPGQLVKVISSADGSLIGSITLPAAGSFGLSAISSNVGDLNGDGIPDFAASDPTTDDNGSNSGTLFFISGAAVGGTFPVISSINGPAEADVLGFGMVAGNFDGSGLNDIITFNANNRVKLISGNDLNSFVYEVNLPGTDGSGFGGISLNTDVVKNVGNIDQSANGSDDIAVVQFTSNETAVVHTLSGDSGSSIWTAGFAPGTVPYAVTSPGDVNGDGVNDVLVASVKGTPGSSETPTGGALIALSGVDGSVIYDIDQLDNFLVLLGDIEPAGDINNDGVNDVYVSTLEQEILPDETVLNTGILSAYSGIDGAAIYRTASPLGPETGNVSNFFGREVVNLGDINNDGLPDTALTAVGADNGSLIDAGAIYILTTETLVDPIIRVKPGGYEATLSPFELNGTVYNNGVTVPVATVFFNAGTPLEITADGTELPVDGETSYNIALVTLKPEFTDSDPYITTITALDEAALMATGFFVSVDAFLPDYYQAQGAGEDYLVTISNVPPVPPVADTVLSTPTGTPGIDNRVTRINEGVCRSVELVERALEVRASAAEANNPNQEARRLARAERILERAVNRLQRAIDRPLNRLDERDLITDEEAAAISGWIADLQTFIQETPEEYSQITDTLPVPCTP